MDNPQNKVKDIHRGHRERLKQRCNEEGLASFTDCQALEMLLFYAVPYRDTNELAHQLLLYFGSFSSVLDADYCELLRVPGVGRNTASLLSSLPEFFRRYQLDKNGPKVCLTTSADAGDYAVKLFIGRTYEAFYLLCLNAQRQLLKAVLLGEGTLTETPVYPRLAVEAVLRYRAHSVILTHNHPGGVLKPSALDLDLTQAVGSALATVGVLVLDHVIVGGNKYISLSNMGLMKNVY